MAIEGIREMKEGEIVIEIVDHIWEEKIVNRIVIAISNKARDSLIEMKEIMEMDIVQVDFQIDLLLFSNNQIIDINKNRMLKAKRKELPDSQVFVSANIF
jgi:hypothetical protein